MRNWSIFAPNLSSWINAFLLAGLLIIATSLIPTLHHLWSTLFYFGSLLVYFLFLAIGLILSILPQFIQGIISGFFSFISTIISYLLTLISPLILLLPIPIIAFAHHYLYLFLDQYYPDIRPIERGRVTGYFPGIVSWWHGLYGLLVVILAMLFSDAILSILPWLSFHSLDHDFLSISDIEISAANRINLWVRIALIILLQPIYHPFMRLVIWVITAAYLYQFEFQVRQHLIASASE